MAIVKKDFAAAIQECFDRHPERYSVPPQDVDIIVGCIGSGGVPELDYERHAHRETTQLLIEKDLQLQAAKSYGEQMLHANNMLWKDHHRMIDLNHLVSLCMPLVQHLFSDPKEATNSTAIYNQCKAAIAAYEALYVPAASRPAGPDPQPVGHAPARHVSDCQDERPQGVAGGQLPGPATWPQDRVLLSLFDGLQQLDGFKTAIVSWGPSASGADLPSTDPGLIAFEIATSDVCATHAEAFAFARAFADGLKFSGDLAVLWRVRPEILRNDDFANGTTEWRFYCRYAVLFKAVANNICGITWKTSLL